MKSQIIELHLFLSENEDLTQLIKTLERYEKLGITLSYDGIQVEPAFLLLIYKHLMYLNRKNLKEKQKEGIQRALKNKSEGYGRYGRPKTLLPDDFDEQVKNCIENNKSLFAYCNEIKLKKSTFYKYAKISQKKMSDGSR